MIRATYSPPAYSTLKLSGSGDEAGSQPCEASSKLSMANTSPGPGDVLAIDNFDDASQGWLPASSPLPDSFSVEYAGGEYVARIIRPDRLYQAVLRGTYRDASIEIDARIS